MMQRSAEDRLGFPLAAVRLLLCLLARLLYRIRVIGHLPEHGPALLVSNHVSFVDWLLIGASTGRYVRFLAWEPFFHGPLGGFLRFVRAIPIGGKDSSAAVQRAQEELRQGNLVCIFAEGNISRCGELKDFRRGLEWIIAGDPTIPVIPVHLGGIFGSVFSFSGGTCFWKLPNRLFRSVTVSYGRPLACPTANQARQGVLEAGLIAWMQLGMRRERTEPISTIMIKAAFARLQRVASPG